MRRYLIVGNGAAGCTAAEEVRARDPQGDLTLVSAEPHPMYSRPGLAYVALKEIPATQIVAYPADWYTQHKVKRVTGLAQTLDTNARRVQVTGHPPLPYDRLLVATGARAVPLPYPGAALEGVVYLDTLDGTRELLRKLQGARRAVVIGGGITALEMAEAFAAHHVETHYLVRRNGLWSAVLNEAEVLLLERRMLAHGVRIHYNAEAAEVLGDRQKRVTGVKLTSGEVLDCQVVGAGIGVKADLGWLKGSPLKIDRGLLVNEYLETNVPDVFAAGDCAQAWDPFTQKHMLDVLWPTAVAQGRVAGANLAGEREVYRKTTPFNACLLFGLHLTAMGQLGSGRGDEPEIVQHVLSRGTSEVWGTRPHCYVSAWTQVGDNSLRLVLDDNRLAGALVIGEQSLADALRDLINWRADLTPLRAALTECTDELPEQLRRFWQTAQAQKQTA